VIPQRQVISNIRTTEEVVFASVFDILGSGSVGRPDKERGCVTPLLHDD
jgi:hypothetical protein